MNRNDSAQKVQRNVLFHATLHRMHVFLSSAIIVQYEIAKRAHIVFIVIGNVGIELNLGLFRFFKQRLLQTIHFLFLNGNHFQITMLRILCRQIAVANQQHFVFVFIAFLQAQQIPINLLANTDWKLHRIRQMIHRNQQQMVLHHRTFCQCQIGILRHRYHHMRLHLAGTQTKPAFSAGLSRSFQRSASSKLLKEIIIAITLVMKSVRMVVSVAAMMPLLVLTVRTVVIVVVAMVKSVVSLRVVLRTIADVMSWNSAFITHVVWRRMVLWIACIPSMQRVLFIMLRVAMISLIHHLAECSFMHHSFQFVCF
mmetsp:Transcript_35833/g.57600  ORF Transcript_35833/g.57600 Transcript_35833/m.57600 type:complete len:311 (-) Transcript_35833:461-1393(-)